MSRDNTTLEIEDACEFIEAALFARGKFVVRGFGTFRLVKRKGWPATSQHPAIKPHSAVAFRPSRKLRARAQDVKL